MKQHHHFDESAHYTLTDAYKSLRGGMAPIMEIFFIFTLGLSYFYMISIFEKETLFQWDTFSYNQRLPW